MPRSFFSASRLALALAFAAADARAETVDFNRDVRPILSSQCFQCHGPDEKARKAKLRLDIREDAIKAGAIVPGKPAESELLTRICSTDPETRMPPPASKKPPLSVAQIATMKQWIVEGATYSDHWSFGKLTRPAVPADAPNPIDAFLRARFTAEKITPAPVADRVTPIRSP